MAYDNNHDDNKHDDENDVFMDKYRLSFNILEQEGILIQQYNHLLRSLKVGYYDSKTITASHDFFDCWATLKGLYDFIRYNKLEDLKKNYSKNIEELNSLIDMYESDKKIIFENLRKGYNLIREFISISGYHKDGLENEIGKFPEAQNF